MKSQLARLIILKFIVFTRKDRKPALTTSSGDLSSHSMVHRIQAAKARKHFASIVERSSQGERIKVTRYGRTLAAIIPKGDLEKLENCEQDELPNKQPRPAGARGDVSAADHPSRSDGRGRR